MLDEWPEISGVPGAPARRRRWSQGTVVSLTLSIGIHVLALVVLVRMGVLRGWSLTSLQGGGAGSDAAGSVNDGPRVEGEAPAQLPAGVAMVAPEQVYATPTDLTNAATNSVMAARLVSAKSPVSLLDSSGAQDLIGVPGAGSQVSPQFSRRLPDRLRDLPSGGAIDGSEVANAGRADAAYLMNQAGDGGKSGNRARVGSTATEGGRGDGGNRGGGGSGFSPSSQNKKPTYPAEAMRRGYEGRVRLAVDLKEDGSVDTIAVDQSSGYQVLDDAALEGVRQWHFNWNKALGRSKSERIFVPIDFVQKGR